MIASHIAFVEGSLLALSKVPGGAGHPNHKGQPREWFVRDFLDSHLSERVAIGTGEVIDAKSEPGEQRNQMDVVVYRRDFPRIPFGGGVHAYLAESVVATLEVKSTLDDDGILKATRAARRLKLLERHLTTSFTAGYHPPNILSYVVAYDGPAGMDTVRGWAEGALKKESIPYPNLPPTGAERLGVTSPALDGVFVLGKGFLLFDNQPLSLVPEAVRLKNPQMRWVYGSTPDQNLLLLFLTLLFATSGVSGSWIDPRHYVPFVSTGTEGVHWSV